MSDAPFMPLWVADFIADTMDLDAKEVGAYMLLLMSMWGRDGYLPNDSKKLQRVARCGREWPKVWQAIQHYFTADGDRITQDRLLRELQKVAAKREVNAQRASRGGYAKALKYKDAALLGATLEACQPEPYPERVEKREAKASPKKDHGSRLSQDWFLPVEWGEWALSEGMDRDGIRSEAEKFRDYWCARAGPQGVKLDWLATWRNWIRMARERGNGNRNSKQISHGGKRIDPAIDQIARLAGLGEASSYGRGGIGGAGEEDGPLWVGARPQ